MRVMVLVKATKNSEAETSPVPLQEMLAQMGRFNEELAKAGVLQAKDGLHPSRRGKRVQFSDGRVSVSDGPFAEPQELVAGYWVWKVSSMEEAVQWARRCPNPMPGETGVLELRPIHEAEDFGEALTPELQAQEERLRAEVERQSGV